jgi:exonuclease III
MKLCELFVQKFDQRCGKWNVYQRINHNNNNNQKKSVRVISYNVNGRLSQRFSFCRKSIALLLKRLQPDILCLQEVNSVSQMKWLAKALNMYCNEKAWHNGGVTILSIYPITNVTVQPIPNSWYNVFLCVETNGISVCSIHLDSRKYLQNEEVRLYETQEILKYINELLKHNNKNKKLMILAGDFNSISHLDNDQSPKQSTNYYLPSHLLQQFGFVDTRVTAEHTLQGTWIPSLHNPSTKSVVQRIDRIYYLINNNTSKKTKVKINQSAIIGPDQLKPCITSWPSGRDHAIVLFDFTLMNSVNHS